MLGYIVVWRSHCYLTRCSFLKVLFTVNIGSDFRRALNCRFDGTTLYLFVCRRCSCGNNKESKTQKEHFKLLMTKTMNKQVRNLIPKFCISRSVRNSIFRPLLYLSCVSFKKPEQAKPISFLQHVKSNLPYFSCKRKDSVFVLPFFFYLQKTVYFPFSILFIPFGTLAYAVLQYWQFSQRYFDNFNLEMRYWGILTACRMRFLSFFRRRRETLSLTFSQPFSSFCSSRKHADTTLFYFGAIHLTWLFYKPKVVCRLTITVRRFPNIFRPRGICRIFLKYIL